MPLRLAEMVDGCLYSLDDLVLVVHCGFWSVQVEQEKKLIRTPLLRLFATEDRLVWNSTVGAL